MSLYKDLWSSLQTNARKSPGNDTDGQWHLDSQSSANVAIGTDTYSNRGAQWRANYVAFNIPGNSANNQHRSFLHGMGVPQNQIPPGNQGQLPPLQPQQPHTRSSGGANHEMYGGMYGPRLQPPPLHQMSSDPHMNLGHQVNNRMHSSSNTVQYYDPEVTASQGSNNVNDFNTRFHSRCLLGPDGSVITPQRIGGGSVHGAQGGPSQVSTAYQPRGEMQMSNTEMARAQNQMQSSHGYIPTSDPRQQISAIANMQTVTGQVNVSSPQDIQWNYSKENYSHQRMPFLFHCKALYKKCLQEDPCMSHVSFGAFCKSYISYHREKDCSVNEETQKNNSNTVMEETEPSDKSLLGHWYRVPDPDDDMNILSDKPWNRSSTKLIISPENNKTENNAKSKDMDVVISSKSSKENSNNDLRIQSLKDLQTFASDLHDQQRSCTPLNSLSCEPDFVRKGDCADISTSSSESAQELGQVEVNERSSSRSSANEGATVCGEVTVKLDSEKVPCSGLFTEDNNDVNNPYIFDVDSSLATVEENCIEHSQLENSSDCVQNTKTNKTHKKSGITGPFKVKFDFHLPLHKSKHAQKQENTSKQTDLANDIGNSLIAENSSSTIASVDNGEPPAVSVGDLGTVSKNVHQFTSINREDIVKKVSSMLEKARHSMSCTAASSKVPSPPVNTAAVDQTVETEKTVISVSTDLGPGSTDLRLAKGDSNSVCVVNSDYEKVGEPFLGQVEINDQKATVIEIIDENCGYHAKKRKRTPTMEHLGTSIKCENVLSVDNILHPSPKKLKLEEYQEELSSAKENSMTVEECVKLTGLNVDTLCEGNDSLGADGNDRCMLSKNSKEKQHSVVTEIELIPIVCDTEHSHDRDTPVTMEIQTNKMSEIESVKASSTSIGNSTDHVVEKTTDKEALTSSDNNEIADDVKAIDPVNEMMDEKQITIGDNESRTDADECEETKSSQSVCINNTLDVVTVDSPYFCISFHNKKLLCVNTGPGKYVLMREVLQQCFRDTVKNILHSKWYSYCYKKVYLAKERDLKIPYMELPAEKRDFVVKYLCDCGVIISNMMPPKHLGIIHINDVHRLYQYFFGLKNCNDNCIKLLKDQIFHGTTSSLHSKSRDDDSTRKKGSDIEITSQEVFILDSDEEEDEKEKKSDDMNNEKYKDIVSDTYDSDATIPYQEEDSDTEMLVELEETESHSGTCEETVATLKISEPYSTTEEIHVEEPVRKTDDVMCCDQETQSQKQDICKIKERDAEEIEKVVVEEAGLEQHDVGMGQHEAGLEQLDIGVVQQETDVEQQETGMEQQKTDEELHDSGVGQQEEGEDLHGAGMGHEESSEEPLERENNREQKFIQSEDVVRGGVAAIYGGLFRFLVLEGIKFFPFEDLCHTFDREDLYSCMKEKMQSKYRAIKCSDLEANFFNRLEPSLPHLQDNAALIEGDILTAVAKKKFEHLFSNSFVDLTKDDDSENVQCSHESEGVDDSREHMISLEENFSNVTEVDIVSETQSVNGPENKEKEIVTENSNSSCGTEEENSASKVEDHVSSEFKEQTIDSSSLEVMEALPSSEDVDSGEVTTELKEEMEIAQEQRLPEENVTVSSESCTSSDGYPNVQQIPHYGEETNNNMKDLSDIMLENNVISMMKTALEENHDPALETFDENNMSQFYCQCHEKCRESHVMMAKAFMAVWKQNLALKNQMNDLKIDIDFLKDGTKEMQSSCKRYEDIIEKMEQTKNILSEREDG